MGLLGRLRGAFDAGSVTTNITTTTQAAFDITVPAAQAEPVRAALQDWLTSKGATAVIAVRTEGESAHLTFSGEAPDLAEPGVAAELGKVLQRVLGQA